MNQNLYSVCRGGLKFDRGGQREKHRMKKKGGKVILGGTVNSIDPVDYVALKFKNKVRILYELLQTTPGFYPRCTTSQRGQVASLILGVLTDNAVIITFTLCSCSGN